MSQAFGHWPLELFTLLPPEQQIAFWKAKVKGRAALEQELVLLVTKQRVKEEIKQCKGEYLPLSVYVQRGFDGQRIQETCTDIQEHPILGTTYKVNIKAVITTDIQRKVWDELLKTKCLSSNNPDEKDKKKKKSNKR